MPNFKKRTIDYSQEDMVKLTGLERRAFTRELIRFCEMYDLDVSDFKVEKRNNDSGYFFTPEIAHLLGVMIRTLNSHPLKRSNAKTSDVSGKDVKNYYKNILGDIDEKLPDIMKKAICGFEGYLVSQNIVDWIEDFAKQLTRFVVNLTVLQEQDIGKTLKLFTMKLDEMNYTLYISNHHRKKVKESSFKPSDDYQMKANMIMNQSNIGVDTIIAEMIRWYLKKSNEIRNGGFEEYVFDNPELISEAIGIDIDKASIDIQREIYCQIEIGRSINQYRVEEGMEIVNKAIEKNIAWKDIPTRMKEGTYKFATQKTKEEKIRNVEEYIKEKEQEIEQYREILTKLKEDDPTTKELVLLKGVQEQYVEYCEQLDKNNNELVELVNNFVGRTILEVLK